MKEACEDRGVARKPWWGLDARDPDLTSYPAPAPSCIATELMLDDSKEKSDKDKERQKLSIKRFGLFLS